MVEKYKLNVVVALIVLLITIWLIWSGMVWDFVGYLLLIGTIALIIWTLILREKKQAKLLEFFVKSLIIFYAATGIIWFIWLSIASPSFYTYFNLQSLMNTLVLVVLPLSLFPVSVSIIIYGIFRMKLKPWEIFLSSWYASIFVIFTIYEVSSEPASPYSSIAGAIGILLTLVFLSLLTASIVTILYVIPKKEKIMEPK